MNKENEIKNKFTPLELLKIMGFQLKPERSYYSLKISDGAYVTISFSQVKKIKNYKDVALTILDEGFYLGQLCKIIDIEKYTKAETLSEYNKRKEMEKDEQRKA